MSNWGELIGYVGSISLSVLRISLLLEREVSRLAACLLAASLMCRLLESGGRILRAVVRISLLLELGSRLPLACLRCIWYTCLSGRQAAQAQGTHHSVLSARVLPVMQPPVGLQSRACLQAARLHALPPRRLHS